LDFRRVLFRSYDILEPAEHNGTVRGKNLAFIAATEAHYYWKNDAFTKEIDEKAEMMSAFVDRIVDEYDELEAERRGRGMMQGVARSEEHTSELQSRFDLVCRLLLEKKK